MRHGMEAAARLASSALPRDENAVLCREVLAAAHAATGGIEGSATACVAVMRPGGSLHVVNIGDSGFRIIRDGACVFASDVRFL